MGTSRAKVQKVMVIFLEKLDGDVEHEQVRRIRDMLPVFHDMLKAADAIDMFTRDVLAT